MSEGLNRVELLGNVGADPEVRTTQGGTTVMNLRLATTERVKNKNDEFEDRVEWHSCVIWGKRAEGLAKVVSKGTQLYIEGSNRTSSYEDRDGNKRYKTEVNANKVLLLGGKRQEGEGGGQPQRPAVRQAPTQQRRASVDPPDDFPVDEENPF